MSGSRKSGGHGVALQQIGRFPSGIRDGLTLIIPLTVYALWSIVTGVLIGDEFEPEFQALHVDVQNEILALAILLRQFGPQLGRPRVDTLKDSRHANMKELRFDAQDGVWRVAFAFDPKRRAILLIAGDKSGGSERRFYRELIRRADGRFDAHLERVKQEREKEKHKKERK
jgi:hypothetical protein